MRTTHRSGLGRGIVVAGVVGLSLGGCGGGGGDTPPATGDLTITAANQDTVSRVGMVALQAGVLGGTGGVAGSGGAVARVAGLGRKRIAAVQPPQDKACDVSGFTTEVHDDRDNSGTLTAGDVVTTTYTDCSDVAGEVTNGTLVATYSQVQISAFPAVIGASATADLRTQTANASVVVQGGLNLLLRMDSLTVDSLRVTVPSALTLAVTTPTYTDTVTLRAGYTLDSAYDGSVLPPGGTVPGRTTSTASGPVASATAAGYVQISTPQPFVQYDVDPYPSSGRFLARGKTGTVQATVLSSSQVQVELDADGNGVFEGTKIVAWSDFF